MAISSPSALLPRTLTAAKAPTAGIRHRATPCLLLPSKPRRCPLRTPSPSTSRSPLLPAISAIHIEDIVEKDWSFLDPDPADHDREVKVDRIIHAAEVGGRSRVLACVPTVGLVDRLVEAQPCELLLATHESLLVLAEIKEKHDAVRCWQGGLEAVPERFSPLDAVFVCYFPAMGVPLGGLLGSLARRCSPGARVVISCDQGRDAVERVHRQLYPGMVTSDLPDKLTLEKGAADHSFQISEFIDESTFYLAVLKLYMPGSVSE